MNIAIYGGSFDPVHIGHEKIIESVALLNDIDKLFVVPTFLNPFKSTFHFTPIQRYEFLCDLFSNKEKVKISDYEISNNKPTPSIKTVEYFKRKYNPSKIFLVIGADNLAKLHKWENFEKLKSEVEFIVVTRRGYEVKNDIIPFRKIDLNIDISSSFLRDKLDIDFIPKKIQKKVIAYDRQNKENS